MPRHPSALTPADIDMPDSPVPAPLHSAKYSGLPKDDVDRANDYKYVLDVDGDSWSKRFPKLLAAQK